MADKRKFDELADPDYPQNSKVAKTDAEQKPSLSPEERICRIRAIAKREFQRELAAKEQEVMEIESRISLVRKLLHRVRYAVVANYYSKKGMDVPDNEAQASVESLNLKSTAPVANERDQRAIHPALKSILGKEVADYEEILKARPMREAAKSAQSSIKEKLRTKKEEKRLQRAMSGSVNTVICHDTTPKVPRHVEPTPVPKEIHQLNAARGKNQSKHLIVVGNTSQYVGNEKTVSGVTHKWLVYVKTKTPVPIEKILTKVRFFLHPSYRPNDIVDVCQPPFQLSQRGWGEFPIRLQLHFEPSLEQKPIQLVHNLVLDKTLTGLQTMGAETLVEMWLNSDHLQMSHDLQFNRHIHDVQCPEDERSSNSDDTNGDHIDDKLMEFLNRIEKQTPKSLCEEGEKIEPTISVPASLLEPVFGHDGIVDMHLNHTGTEMDTKSSLAGINETSSHTTDNDDGKNISSVTKITDDTGTVQSLGASHDYYLETGLDSKEEPVLDVPKPHSTLKCISSEMPNNLPLAISSNAGGKFSGVEASRPPASRGILRIMPPTPIVRNASMQNSQQQAQPVHLLSKVQNSSESATKIQSTMQPTIITPIGPTTNKTEMFQKRVVKCIDKHGNIKYIELLVKSSNGQNKPIVLNTNPGLVQKAVLLPKALGQSQSKLGKPVVVKLAPSTSANPVKIVSNPCTNKATLVPLSNQSTAKVISSPVPSHAQAVVQPSISKENQSNSASTSPIQNNSNKNQVLVKNGKMYIIDPLQAKIKQQRKQESLLKPQVSLLKPIVKNDNFANCIRNDAKGVFNHTAIATDHDYTSFLGKSVTPNQVTIHKMLPIKQRIQPLSHKQKTSIVTVNSPNNSRINVRVTKIEDDEEDSEEGDDGKVWKDRVTKLSVKSSAFQRPTALMQKPRRDYSGELEETFFRVEVTSVRHATEWVLKRLSLVNAKAASIDYSMSFPFVVQSQAVFGRLLTPKLHALEWLRAKYVFSLLQKHPSINRSKLWTTKEIILFARLHAYTPVINYKTSTKAGRDEAADSTLKDLVKKEIKREKYDISTVTLVHETYDWMTKMRQTIKRELEASEDVVDIEGVGTDDEEDVSRKTSNQSPLKNLSGKFFHPIAANLETEASFVNDTCQQIGIRLCPEEIVPDVVHPSAQLVLVQCLKSFVGDLVRRAAACEQHVDAISSLIERTVRPDDVKNAILNRPQWDFLTNNRLGVAKPKELKE